MSSIEDIIPLDSILNDQPWWWLIGLWTLRHCYDTNTGIWWYYDYDNITKISDLPKGVILERVTPKKYIYVRINRCIICGLYQNNPSYKIQLHFFQKFANMSKINHIKKVIEDMNLFRKYFRVRQEVSDEIKTRIYFIKHELQTYIETNISCKKPKEKLFWLNGDGLKHLLTMNPMKKLATKRNTTSDNITYLVDLKKMCQHNNFHPLTAIRGKLI